jgi:molybdopterin synthase catalytic subunit
MASMTVRVRLFAVLRERAGSDSIEVELPEGGTVSDVLERLADEPPLDAVLERMPVRMAVNRAYAADDTRLTPDDELALIPPISGGAEPHVRVAAEPLSLESLTESVGRRGAGAVVSFQGVTREVDRLDYEAYAEMAEERMRRILLDCVERHGLEAAAAEHRTGPVPRGEAIDRIKAEAPIWKREVENDAARWVEGEQPAVDA